MKRFHLSLLALLFFLAPALLTAQRPLGPPFLVNAPDEHRHQRPAVAANARGGT